METAQHLLVFDYCQGTVDLNDKKTYVLASHVHPDHYNPEIFAWRRKRSRVQYILSYDIGRDPAVGRVGDSITFMHPDQEKWVDDLKVKAYTSTDEGVAFLVQCEGINIFHAGDLNWWSWPGDIPEEIEKAEIWFKTEIARIKGEQIDVAFFPVDPRLEYNYGLGAEYFINEIKPRYLIPMHFWDDYQLLRSFQDRMQGSFTKVIGLTHRGQEIELVLNL